MLKLIALRALRLYIRMMDRDVVETQRESQRIREFLQSMVSRGRITAFEQELVRQEGIELMRQIGYIDAQGLPAKAEGEEYAGVVRHGNHLKKAKLCELHPELAEELESHIAHRPYHPLPPVPAELARPGVAYRQYRKLMDYIDAMREAGTITRDDAYDIYEPIHVVFADSGVFIGDAADARTPPAVLIQSYHKAKAKLLELHPELAEELRKLESSRSR